MNLGQRRVLRVNGDAAAITLLPVGRLCAQVEEHAEHLHAGPNAQVCLTQRDEARQLRKAVGPQMVGLQPVESKKLLEERARRQPQSPLQVRGEHDELALLRVRRDILWVGSTGSHFFRHSQKPPPAEPADISVAHAGAHPSTGARH